jgi:glycosyltransferase involved in cell wall biosynthesis
MKIGYICTNFNNSAYTGKAVESLLANLGHDIVIVVVDNRSNFEDIERLRDLARRHTEVRLVLQDKNLGYFSGLNSGISYLRTNFPDIQHAVVGNNDLVFALGFVDSITQRLPVLQQYPVVSPDIVTLEGVHQNPHVICGISWWRELLYDLYYTHYYFAVLLGKLAQLTRRFTARGEQAQWKAPNTIYQGHGSCYILGPRFFANFSELWAPTFLFGEEYFLSKQLTDLGMAVYYEPWITVQHCCNAAIGRLPRIETWRHAQKAHRVYRQYVGIFNSTMPPIRRNLTVKGLS